jgi:uncharacterized membrane protein (UPF0127 family)
MVEIEDDKGHAAVMNRWFLGLFMSVLFLSGGCRKPEAAPSAAGNEQGYLNRAQPKLPTIKLWLGSQEIVAEVARTPVQLQTGMMFRQTMGENEGMLFVFSQPQRAAFYMRNTTLPLSCAYIDDEGAILEIYDLTPLEEKSVVAKSTRVRFVLETRQGWFAARQIGPGVVVRTERGSLLPTFFGSP